MAVVVVVHEFLHAQIGQLLDELERLGFVHKHGEAVAFFPGDHGDGVGLDVVVRFLVVRHVRPFQQNFRLFPQEVGVVGEIVDR